MTNINKHKHLLARILKDIYQDIELANLLGFKGGTALMFFYNLPRFSVDLDFNLLTSDRQSIVFDKIKHIISSYGNVHDEAIKHHGIILVLDYGSGERKLKIEISNRQFPDHYEILDFLGMSVRVMKKEDMFAHKMVALLDRNTMANRDLFDCWFFLKSQTPINPAIIELRTKQSLEEYLQNCIDHLESTTRKDFLHGLGDLMDEKMKYFVRNQLKEEVLSLLKTFKAYPLAVRRGVMNEE